MDRRRPRQRADHGPARRQHGVEAARPILGICLRYNTACDTTNADSGDGASPIFSAPTTCAQLSRAGHLQHIVLLSAARRRGDYLRGTGEHKTSGGRHTGRTGGISKGEDVVLAGRRARYRLFTPLSATFATSRVPVSSGMVIRLKTIVLGLAFGALAATV